MVVVLVVGVAVLVHQRFVSVLVLVVIGKKPNRSRDHEPSGKGRRRRNAITKYRDRNECTREGCSREQRRFARRADEAERVSVQQDARAIADRAEREGGGDNPHVGPPGTSKQQRDEEIDRGSAVRLEPHDRERISQGQALSEIVVDRPCRARPGDEDDTPHIAADRAASAEYRRAEHDHSSGKPTSRAQVLSKCDYRQKRSEGCLQVQQQRSRDGRDPFESDQQQHRSGDTTEQHDQHQCRQVTTAERCLMPISDPSAERQYRRRSRVQQTREQLGIAVSDEALRERRAQTERCSRKQTDRLDASRMRSTVPASAEPRSGRRTVVPSNYLVVLSNHVAGQSAGGRRRAGAPAADDGARAGVRAPSAGADALRSADPGI
ncbi:MAG TPA: hypothetical protein VIK61_04695 [Acidimicrobiia bacterium]